MIGTAYHDLAAAALAVPLASLDQSNRADFLRATLDAAAGGLAILEGREKTAEALYRAADAVVVGGRG